VNRVALFCLLLLTALPSLGQREQEGIVATQSSALRVREAPRADAKVIAAAQRGERVAILDRTSDGLWLRVRNAKNETGWVSAQYVSVPTPPAAQAQTQTEGGAWPWIALAALVLLGLYALSRWTPEEPAQKAARPPPPVQKPRERTSAGGSGAAWAWSVAFAAVVAVGLYVWVSGPPQPSPSPSPPQPQPQPTPTPTPQLAEVDACRDAMVFTEPDARDSSEQREQKELEGRWIQYLASIQSQGDHANWEGKPCDEYLQSHRRTAAQAMQTGFASIQAYGNNLQTVTVRVTVSTPGSAYIIVPVGTVFASSSAGTQNMMAAGSFHFSFAPVPASDSRSSLLERLSPVRQAHAMYRPSANPRWIEGEVKAYCINRWREVPASDTRLTVTFPDPSDRLPRLVACLEDQSAAEHGLRQFAVWMVSDNLLDMTPQQLEERIYQEIAAKLPARAQRLSGADLAAFLKRVNPSVGEDVLAAFRNLSGEELAKARDAWLRGRQAEARKAAEENLPVYARTETLLRACGIDVTNSAFFRK
jgi:hypothetical protein